MLKILRSQNSRHFEILKFALFVPFDICNFWNAALMFPATELTGPQTDLHWVTVDAVRDVAKKLSEQWRFQPAEACPWRKGKRSAFG